MATLSPRFRELWTTEDRCLSMEHYEFCMTEWQNAHTKKMVVAYVLTFLLFAAGLWALAERAIEIAVFLLALATNFNLVSHNHTLVHELLNSQRLLAMLVNKQTQAIEALRADTVP